uniref:RNase_PH domain-containing protein n=1 Tax=Rhabditophanes sp. KR3021 TaxID=114890 RepID=A0AC35TSZ5_9BILA
MISNEKSSYSKWSINLSELDAEKSKDEAANVPMETDASKIEYKFREIVLASNVIADAYACGYAKLGKTEVIAYMDEPTFMDDSQTSEQKIVKFKIDAEYRSELNDIPRIFAAIVREQNRTIRYRCNIIVKVNDGGLMTAAVMAINIAFMEAGIQLSDTLIAATIGICGENEQVVIDPDMETLKKCELTLSYAICPQLNLVVLCDQVGCSKKFSNNKIRDFAHYACVTLKDSLLVQFYNLFHGE